MGKQIHEIKLFDKGITSTASEADIGTEYTSTSLNVDPRARLGFLSSTQKSSDTGHEILAADMIIIKDKNNGTIIVGFSNVEELSDTGLPLGVISIVKDIYGDGS